MTTSPEGRVRIALPGALLRALAGRSGTIERAWREGRRTYAHAVSPEGPLFLRASSDPIDRSTMAHEAEVRAIVGQDGPLRAPAVLVQGPGWLLEVGVVSEPWTGAGAVDRLLAAAERLAGLPIPPRPGPPFPARRIGRLWDRARLLGSRVPAADLVRARSVLSDAGLPAVTGHGDYHPGNVLRADDAVWVVDWELTGPLPAGHDLLQFWSNLPDAAAREQLFEGTVALVGSARRPELLRLRYAVAVRTAASLRLARPAPATRAVELADLLALLPGLRAEAGLD